MSAFAKVLLWLVEHAVDGSSLTVQAKLVLDSLAIGTITAEEYVELCKAGRSRRAETLTRCQDLRPCPELRHVATPVRDRGGVLAETVHPPGRADGTI